MVVKYSIKSKCAGRVGIKGQELQIENATLVEGGASINPEKLDREFLDYILRDGWIDIAGQCANTISARNSGACGM